jgi:phosphatidylserine/phosphatidylglycerophosphate/cardiolipin synthase-like enzyme
MEDARCQVHLYPDTSQALYMHCEKQIITDGTRVLIGSQNASVASLVYNRELSLQVTAAQALTLVRSVTATFNYDYVKAAAIGLSQPGRREVASAGFDSR